ncbi:RNA polymerase sigma factor [Dysgonomonas sp. ZJ709]|uniref:RNA polymerase sigma factor n=1 Tax=Dysgonomonas sp. ZJ709 TaxID=2709797 RepID=UPI0013ED0795|nr:RNA polymerase sigma-70 factor [Dysgonomonas sp. ZJ709]
MQNDKTTYERELILRLMNDDQAAFQGLYLLYRKRIFSTVYGFIRNKEFAEDIYQETFTTIWQNRNSLNPDTNFSSFIYTIVRNKVFDYLRSISKYERLPESFLSHTADDSADILEQLKATELQDLLNEELKKLNKQQRCVFNMSREQNLSYIEIADHLGISVYRVNYLLSGALKSIRYNLSRYGILSVLWLLF